MAEIIRYPSHWTLEQIENYEKRYVPESYNRVKRNCGWFTPQELEGLKHSLEYYEKEKE